MEKEVETLLALGGTRWEAARGPVRQALQTGLTPIMNAMMVVGIVSLPGMMTGQILAGAEPGLAVRYQILIFLLIAAGTGFVSGLIAIAAMMAWLRHAGFTPFVLYRILLGGGVLAWIHYGAEFGL